MTECCGTCLYRRDGRCHRNQPFIVIIGSQHKAAWPPVPEHEWCGEYQPTVEASVVSVSAYAREAMQLLEK